MIIKHKDCGEVDEFGDKYGNLKNSNTLILIITVKLGFIYLFYLFIHLFIHSFIHLFITNKSSLYKSFFSSRSWSKENKD